MLSKYLERAENGEGLWIGELRKDFSENASCSRMILRLTCCEGSMRDFTLWLPRWENEQEKAFILEYFSASVFNLLSCFGGRELRFYLQEDAAWLAPLVMQLDEVFQVQRSQRCGYGKVVSISNRLNRAFGTKSFRFVADQMSQYQSTEPQRTDSAADLGARLRCLTKMAGDKLCCGIDVGGTDIKAAVSLNGQLLYTKEYDWDPASFSTARELMEPIVLITRLLRLSAVCPVDTRFLSALNRQADLRQIRETVSELEGEFSGDLRLFDSVGLSFPDVVIGDRILGGETPKTSGIRRNQAVDYEEEFARLGELRAELNMLCAQEGQVRIANDGSIAAFTAAMEMACKGEPVSEGVFAHSLGTDLGTGWLTEEGDLPPMPLEMYDFLLDLGSRPQRTFPPEDIRSVRNENSGLPDARKYLGQSAAFRLAQELVPNVLKGFLTFDNGMLQVQKQPQDQRKACLESLMRCAEAGDSSAAQIFRQIGCNLGQISREIQTLLHPKTNRRYVYGRFVKHPACFSLLREGFETVMPGLELIAADDGLACSPLMLQLAARKETTVAQFGQAVGAIYFGLMKGKASN